MAKGTRMSISPVIYKLGAEYSVNLKENNTGYASQKVPLGPAPRPL